MSKARKWALAIGIAIVLAMFVNYGIQTFYKAPKYEDYCRYYMGSVVEPAKYGAVNCTTMVADESFSRNCSDSKGYIDWERDANGCAVKPFCNTCQRDWDKVQNDYNKNVFIVLVILGALSIVGGILLKVDSVAIGFLIGGILNIIIGTIRYWSGLQDVGRFLILGAVLALFVWVGIKKVRD
jgi:hypothetical protein